VPAEMIWIVALTLLASVVLTDIVRRYALAHSILDVPNQRSSHSAPVPRGGGLSVVVLAGLGCLALALFGRVSTRLVVALLAGGGAVAAVGFVDDRRPLPARFRLATHVAAAALAVAALGAVTVLPIAGLLVPLGWAGVLLTLLGIVWTLNLFNFMDGIDGIAASEAVFVAGAGTVLSLLHPDPDGIAAAGAVFCAAVAGFLAWNWPPARIFMGDVGSGFLGFFIAALALADVRNRPADLWVWLILGGVFFVDATMTLVRRLLRGERIHEAHRSHAYQRLARRWGSHRRVTLIVVFINLVWLLPWAVLASLHPNSAPVILVTSLTPLAVLVFLAGAGTPDGLLRRV